jgi:uncharacterized OsmC-like protein
MGASTIKEALAGATNYVTAHPDEARYRDSAATATLGAGLVVNVTGPGDEAITTDMVPSVGGTGSAPSPGWLFRAAAASCVATLIAMRAATLDIAIEELGVTVDSESDDRGILGIDTSVPAGPLSLRVAVSIKSPGAGPEAIRELAEWAVAYCPVTDAVSRAVPTEVEITA